MSNSVVSTWKKDVFTLLPRENRTRTPCLGTKCEHSLKKSINELTPLLIICFINFKLKLTLIFWLPINFDSFSSAEFHSNDILTFQDEKEHKPLAFRTF